MSVGGETPNLHKINSRLLRVLVFFFFFKVAINDTIS